MEQYENQRCAQQPEQKCLKRKKMRNSFVLIRLLVGNLNNTSIGLFKFYAEFNGRKNKIFLFENVSDFLFFHLIFSLFFFNFL